MRLSVGIITLNEEKKLAQTLDAIKEIANEIIILDSGSTDNTKKIAEQFGATFIHQDWLGYGRQRNKCYEYCNCEWILCIDADEVVSYQLKNKIKEIINSTHSASVYSFVRHTDFCGYLFRYGAFGNSPAIRLFRKNAGYFNDNEVHEKFITNEKIIKLNKKYPVYHFSYHSFSQYLTALDNYTTLAANELYKINKRTTIWNFIVNPLLAFVKDYIFQLGFLEGVNGLFSAILNAVHKLIKYWKLYQLNKNKLYQ